MNRRGFLAAILASGVAPAIVKAANIMPVFVRPPDGVILRMSLDGGFEFENVLLTPSMITREALRIMHHRLAFVDNINRNYKDDFSRLNVVVRPWAAR